MIGKLVSHYRILEKLGEGGMGVVYAAEDTRLGRRVALKFLPPGLTANPDAKARFMHEARSASSLEHPAICSIHEVGETGDGQLFICMACYDGEPLSARIARGPLEIDEATNIAIQVAEGLAEAGARGIVHRDIKPGNILLTENGRVKIVDFGLAKLAGATRLTAAGTTMGTAAYMSPEQVRGEEVDHRSDIWSLGAVLYEMITGKPPFGGETELTVMYSIMNSDLRRMSLARADVPPALEQIVERMLARDLTERYLNAADAASDLSALVTDRRTVTSLGAAETTASSVPPPSIAVMPFVDMSADRDQEYFCDGMAEEIMNALTHIEGLRVVARTSAFAFKGKSDDIREIGRKLKVGTLLEGSVRKSGNRMRVTAELVNVRDGFRLWSERYDRDVEDVFAIQDEISLAIVDTLRVRLVSGDRERILRRHTGDPEALNLCLKGRYFWNKRTPDNLRRAIDHYERAIARDPDYALAYAGTADCYVVLPDYSSVPPRVACPKAREAAMRALEIDDTLAEAHATLALVRTVFEWDWTGAEREFERAISLNPSYATAHSWYALYLMWMGRMEEALAEMEAARELDPLSLVIGRNLAQICIFARRYDQAIDVLHRTIEMDPAFPVAHVLLGEAYAHKSMKEEAVAEFLREKALSDDFSPGVDTRIGSAYVRLGMRDKAEEVLRRLAEQAGKSYVKPSDLAEVLFSLGETDRAFECLDQAVEQRDKGVLGLKVYPVYDDVREDPRFIALLNRMGLDA
ncbi:MAG: protein kinase [Candidatus Eisenbacteria bacterium]|nr:protein kinase [Candidatus Eisenbacteria bacterium]